MVQCHDTAASSVIVLVQAKSLHISTETITVEGGIGACWDEFIVHSSLDVKKMMSVVFTCPAYLVWLRVDFPLGRLLPCFRVVIVKPCLTFDIPGHNIPGRLHHENQSVEASCIHQHGAASYQLFQSLAQIWEEHDAYPIQQSESVGISHNQFLPH